MTKLDAPDAVPYWTAQMFKAGSGLDHLGLAAVATDKILPRLAPGINVLTTRPRYWSFYAFVLSEFWKRDLPRTRASFLAWYRPLECIYSVACLLCEDDGHLGSPVGSLRVSPLVKAEPAAYDPQFDYMKTPGGGFGLYYATVMQSLGLVVLANRTDQLPVDAVTPVGQVVADAFRSAIAETEYYQSWIDRHDEPVPAGVVAEYAAHGCLCRLRHADAPDRELLVDAFLHGGEAESATARRHTLRYMCELAAQTDGYAIEASAFRRLVYFGEDYPDEDGVYAAFTPTPDLAPAARRWRLYQAREYYNAAINEMWRRLINWGLDREGDIYPPHMSEVEAALDECDFAGFAASFEATFNVTLPTGVPATTTPMSEAIDWARAAANVADDLDARWEFDAALHEANLIAWLDFDRPTDEFTPDRLAAAFLLLTLVAGRIWNPAVALQAPDDWFPVVEGGRDRLGMQRFIADLGTRAAAGATVGDVLRWLTIEYVIVQHERVAAAKLATTGDTFRFRREGDRLRFFRKDVSVGMVDPRFNALATFLYELGWAGYLYEDEHPLTPEGEALRLDGDLPATGRLVPPARHDGGPA